MPHYTDQTNHTINLGSPPQRIISLVPSQSELLYDLGLEKEVAGITKFCIHPESWFRQKTRVGGTKQLKMEIIHSLKPDLIIANKEENVKEQVEELARHYPVWTSDINNLDDAYEMIQGIGSVTGRANQADRIVNNIRKRFQVLKPAGIPLAIGKKAAYLIWQNPLMSVGGDTFIHSMLQAAGFSNVFAGSNRYPATDLMELKNLQPDYLLLSSEPFPFREKHREAMQKELPDIKVILANGEYFSWYGSRLLHAPAYFKQLQEQMK